MADPTDTPSEAQPTPTALTVEGGKYTFIVQGGHVFIHRHGEPWLEVEEGSKALIALLGEHEQLMEQCISSPEWAARAWAEAQVVRPEDTLVLRVPRSAVDTFLRHLRAREAQGMAIGRRVLLTTDVQVDVVPGRLLEDLVADWEQGGPERSLGRLEAAVRRALEREVGGASLAGVAALVRVLDAAATVCVTFAGSDHVRPEYMALVRLVAEAQATMGTAVPSALPRWQPKIMRWDAYPPGTRARSTSGSWVKLEDGQWQADGGDTFPTPAGDATHVLYPRGLDPVPAFDGSPYVGVPAGDYELGREHGGRARFDRCKEDIARALNQPTGPALASWEALVASVREVVQRQHVDPVAVAREVAEEYRRQHGGGGEYCQGVADVVQALEARQAAADTVQVMRHRSAQERAIRAWFTPDSPTYHHQDAARQLLPRLLVEHASSIVVDGVVVKDRSGPYWVAATSPMGGTPAWAVGNGDHEVLHTHDQQLAHRVRALLNGNTPHPSDPWYERSYEQQVLAACTALGFGRVMQVAEEAWAEADPVGALTGGPAQGTLDARGFRTCSDLVDAWDRQQRVATGRMGYRDGLARDACPYGGDPDAVAAWTEGWDEAAQLVQVVQAGSQHVVLPRREVVLLQRDAQRWATVRGEVLRLDAQARPSVDGVTMEDDDVEPLVLGALRQVEAELLRWLAVYLDNQKRGNDVASANGLTEAQAQLAVAVAARCPGPLPVLRSAEQDEDGCTVTIRLSRGELRSDNPYAKVWDAVYQLAQALFEWGGEYNRKGDGQPLLRVYGHHEAQRMAELVAGEWLRLRDGTPPQVVREHHPVKYERSYEQQVLEACERIGCRRVMQVAERAWADADPVGVQVIGPAQGILDRLGFITCSDLVDAWDVRDSAAFRQGALAAAHGEARTSNPHVQHEQELQDEEVAQWDAGWAWMQADQPDPDTQQRPDPDTQQRHEAALLAAVESMGMAQVQRLLDEQREARTAGDEVALTVPAAREIGRKLRRRGASADTETP